MRTFVIGDIHGGLKALRQVIERAGVAKEDKLIFLGDYVDGWSESAQVINYLQQLDATNHCIFIKGNHDAWCEEWLRSGKANTTWVAHGGRETIESYKSYSNEQKKVHLAFFERLKYYHVDSHNRLFIHAGYTSLHGPEREMFSAVYNWDRTLWELALALDKSIPQDSKYYPKRLLLYKEIYLGHTPTLYVNVTTPMCGANVWNIDTGAAFRGKLSILNIETKAFWQSDMLPDLYQDEKGRNKD